MEIQGYSNYIVYRDGRIWNEKLKRFMKQSLNVYGYCHIGLCNNGSRYTRKVHRLVAEAYIPNPENKPDVDHINRDKTDNRVENLRWVTPLENNQNRCISNSNTSGHIGITYDKKYKGWRYQKKINDKRHFKRFKTKTEALCYKYILLLRIKAGNFN